MSNIELEWTGERLVTSIKSIGSIEHLHRYALALEFIENKTVLDIASGEGYGSNLLSNKAKYVIGIDISRESILHASNKYKKENLAFKVGSVTNIPIETSSIDVVVSFETLEHIREQDEMLNEIKRVLKPAGILIISTPEKENYEDINKNVNPFHLKELYFNEFENLIKRRFPFYSFLFQKQINGSILVPIEKTAKYIEYSGNFNSIESYNFIYKPVFNICIASEIEIPVLAISYFDASEYYRSIIDEFNIEKNKLLNSNTYKLVKLLRTPYHFITKILK